MACRDCQECERLRIGTVVPGTYNDDEMCAEGDLSLDGIERCPWPSKRVEANAKYKAAYKMFKPSLYNKGLTDIGVELMFITACKNAGLK